MIGMLMTAEVLNCTDVLRFELGQVVYVLQISAVVFAFKRCITKAKPQQMMQ